MSMHINLDEVRKFDTLNISTSFFNTFTSVDTKPQELDLEIKRAYTILISLNRNAP